MFQPAWGANSATVAVRDAVGILFLLLKPETLTRFSDSGCLTRSRGHWLIQKPEFDNTNIRLNNQLGVYKIHQWI